LSKTKDIKGIKFGKLTAIEIDTIKSTSERTYWWCKCECDNPNLVSVYLYQLTSEKTKSCGCVKKISSLKGKRRVETYKKKSRLYSIWDGMIQRCENKNNQRYSDYGGRGICVCREWKTYITFEQWAFNNDYQDDLSIDRINNDKNYEPDNCKWSTTKEQGKNKRNTPHVIYENKEYLLNDLLDEKQLIEHYNSIYVRIFNLKWSVKESMEIPIGFGREEYKFINYLKEEFSTKQKGYIITKSNFKEKYNITTQNFKYSMGRKNVINILNELNINNERYKLIKY